MILDAGIVHFLRPTQEKSNGNIPAGFDKEYLSSWYGERNVSFRRFFEARQAGQRIDAVIRILRPERDLMPWADDICILADEKRYRIKQIQPVRDEEAGEDVLDISLERVDGIWQ